MSSLCVFVIRKLFETADVSMSMTESRHKRAKLNTGDSCADR